MKTMKRILNVAAITLLASTAHAAPIAAYDSGVVAAGGNAGAVDPTTVTGGSWTASAGLGTNNFATGYDSGNGGWRIVDGTSTLPALYSKSLATPSDLANPWELTWTLSLDSDAIGSPSGFSDNYYLPPNQSRQANQHVLVETVAGDTILLFHQMDASGNLYINDGVTSHQITTGGSNSGYDNFLTLTVAHDGAGGYTLYEGANSFSLSTNALHGQNRVVFGASSSSGQGSAIWNELELAATNFMTIYSTVTGADDNNQAGPMYGQSFTASVGSTLSDAATEQKVMLTDVSFQTSSSGVGSTASTVYLNVYDDFNVDGTGVITTLGSFIGSSSSTIDFSSASTNQQVTWLFDNLVLDKGTEYFYVLSTTATDTGAGDIVGAGFELDTGNPYAGGQAWRANGNTSDWDLAFKANFINSIPAPAALPAGLVMLAAIGARRWR